MRWILLSLALLSGGLAAYLAVGKTSSFTGYSWEQLALLEEAYAERAKAAPSADEEHAFSRELLQDERRRRIAWPIAAAAAGLLTLLGVFVPSRGRRRAVTAEEARLMAAMGPLDRQSPDRLAAAQALGVDLKAPRAVIEAAHRAQIEALPSAQGVSDPSRLRLIDERRRILDRARDTLLLR